MLVKQQEYLDREKKDMKSQLEENVAVLIESGVKNLKLGSGTGMIKLHVYMVIRVNPLVIDNKLLICSQLTSY